MIKIKIKKAMQKNGAIAVILNKENETLIMLRPSNAHWAPKKWGFPGGKIEPGEEPLEAATRETKEETQLDVYKLRPVNLELDTPVYAYYTRDYEGDVQIDYEHEDWTWVSINDIGNYDLAPQVLDLYEWVLKHG
jgi:8-oxo-dGTP diphosphatase